MNAEIQLYLENHTTRKDETCTITLVRTVDSNDTSIVGPTCISGAVHGKKKDVNPLSAH